MGRLNYHHLRYFWAIAHERSLTRAAERLHVSQSALSVQLRQLEEQLGHGLFERGRKRLALTESGRIALDYADTIFRAGDELVSTLQGRGAAGRQVLRIGAVTTLSRNFQLELLRPLLSRDDVEIVVRSGTLRELLVQLEAHTVDVVLANMAVPRDAHTRLYSHLLAEQPVSLVARPVRARRQFQFPDDLRDTPLIVPSLQSNIRVAFDLLLEQAGVRPRIVAEVDDMAMLRLLARESSGVTLVPPVVVQQELAERRLVERCRIPQIRETFYAITPSRRFPSPILRDLLARLREAKAVT
jgi:LysR family transcriptional activator of nhaA